MLGAMGPDHEVPLNFAQYMTCSTNFRDQMLIFTLMLNSHAIELAETMNLLSTLNHR